MHRRPHRRALRTTASRGLRRAAGAQVGYLDAHRCKRGSLRFHGRARERAWRDPASGAQALRLCLQAHPAHGRREPRRAQPATPVALECPGRRRDIALVEMARSRHEPRGPERTRAHSASRRPRGSLVRIGHGQRCPSARSHRVDPLSTRHATCRHVGGRRRASGCASTS